MLKKISNLLVAFIIISFSAKAEDALKFKTNAYLDTYISLENDNSVKNSTTPRQLTYISPYKDKVGINMAMISFSADYGKARSTFAFQAGDLVHTAFGDGTGLTKTPIIQQANVGYNVYDKFWVDAGYFLTHIGGEALLPKDNWLSSHSLVTYYEPFYQSGIRLSYEGEKFTGQLHLLNGNGIIDDNNLNKTFGVFLSYKLMDNFVISYANVIGNEEADTLKSKPHFLNNFCAQWDATSTLSIKGQFDYATKADVKVNVQDQTVDLGSYMGASVALRYAFTEQFTSTFRFAFVNNEDGVYSPELNGMGLTLGTEYKPTKNSYIRLEGTMFNMDDKYKIFTDSDNKEANSKMELMLNFGIYFE